MVERLGEIPWSIPCTKVRISPAWSFKNQNIIYNKSRRAITNLRRELYTECTLGEIACAVLFLCAVYCYSKLMRQGTKILKNHNIIYNKSRRAITNLRRELYTECTLGKIACAVLFLCAVYCYSKLMRQGTKILTRQLQRVFN